MKIKLCYFKLSGKFYSKGEYESKFEEELDIVNEIHSMHNKGIHPGLVDDSYEFLVVAIFPSGLPHLFL